MIKPPKNPWVLELIEKSSSRSRDLSSLKPIKKTEGRFCAWCTEVQLFDHRQKYCSPSCSTNAMAHFYPQKEEGLYLLLYKQEFKCALCQFDYAAVLDELVKNKRYDNIEKNYRESFSLYFMKILKSNTLFNKRPEVDHIIPIYKGGQSLGLDNHQVICYDCHKTKTAQDLAGKRKK